MLTSHMSPEKVIILLIENYFENIRTFCTQNLTPSEITAVQQTGTIMLHSMISVIISNAEPKRQVELFENVQRRFMFVLMDYDRKWVWELLEEFTLNLPEQMLH